MPLDHLWTSFINGASIDPDLAISEPLLPPSHHITTVCHLADPQNLTEYFLRIKTLPAVIKPDIMGGAPSVDDAGTAGLVQVRLHGRSPDGGDRCTGWIDLKHSFPTGKAYEFSIAAPNVGQVSQVDLKNESTDMWTPEALLIKRGPENDRWGEATLGKGIGAPEHVEFSALMSAKGKFLSSDGSVIMGKVEDKGGVEQVGEAVKPAVANALTASNTVKLKESSTTAGPTQTAPTSSSDKARQFTLDTVASHPAPPPTAAPPVAPPVAPSAAPPVAPSAAPPVAAPVAPALRAPSKASSPGTLR